MGSTVSHGKIWEDPTHRLDNFDLSLNSDKLHGQGVHDVRGRQGQANPL